LLQNVLIKHILASGEDEQKAEEAKREAEVLAMEAATQRTEGFKKKLGSLSDYIFFWEIVTT
jgi:hypothetical protein